MLLKARTSLIPIICLFFSLLAKGQNVACEKIFRDWDNAHYNSLAEERAALQKLLVVTRSDIHCYVSLYRHLGILLHKSGDLDSAIIVYTRAAKMFDSIQFYIGTGSSYDAISSIYSDLNNHTEARRYMQMALEVYQKHDIHIGICDALTVLANIYSELDSLKMAENYCLRSIGLKIKYGFKDGLIESYIQMAFIQLDLGHKDKAVRYARMAEQQLANLNDPYYQMLYSLNLGQIYTADKQFNHAETLLRRSYRLSFEENSIRDRDKILEGLVDLFEGTGQCDSALLYSHLRFQIKDSISQSSSEKEIADASQKYQTEKTLLELKNQQLETENSRRLNIFLAGGLAFLVIIIVLVIRFFNQRRRIQKKQAELESAQALLRGQEAERERIALELHDRVGSMISAARLQFVALLELDEEKHDAEEVSRAMQMLDQSYQEVRRISHDLDNGLLRDVGLHTALGQLTQVISKTSRLKIQYIDTGVRSEINADVQTELYRITQELIANTIKYAKAKEVSIQLSRTGETIIYSYEDDGIGFDKTIIERSPGLGFRNILTRVKRINGTLHLESSPGRGTNVIIEIPIT